jgi:hypothetical protein
MDDPAEWSLDYVSRARAGKTLASCSGSYIMNHQAMMTSVSRTTVRQPPLPKSFPGLTPETVCSRGAYCFS